MFNEVYFRRNLFNRTLLEYINEFEHRADTEEELFYEIKSAYDGAWEMSSGS